MAKCIFLLALLIVFSSIIAIDSDTNNSTFKQKGILGDDSVVVSGNFNNFNSDNNSSTVIGHENLLERVQSVKANTELSFSSSGSESTPTIALIEEQLVSIDTAVIRGLRVEESSKPVSYQDSASVVLADSVVLLRLFGDNFSEHTIIRFVTESKDRGVDCDDVPSTKSFELKKADIKTNSALVFINLPPLDIDEKEFYLCARESNFDMPWVHQGPEKWLIMKSYKKWLPLWAHICLLVFLLLLSGLFSGLNLGLMAMDRTELKIIGNTGTEKERRYAKNIHPLRNNGNFLLCSLLLGNVMVNSTLTILLDDLTTGLIAVIGSTLGIVIFGEIIPQAFCSRHGLAVGARTVWITKITMALTSPLSYPVSMLLDKVLGEEIGNVYNRKRLMELIKVTEHYNDLEKDEVNVIEGVLKLSQSTCADVMTKIEDVYMLPLDSILDFDTISEIMSSGFSRIPVYEGSRGNVISLLYTKDLAFVDPDDRLPLKTICQFYHYPCNFVEDIKPLDSMFKEFKEGNKGHMALVQRIHVSDNSDPYYEIIGVVTLEDVIEELIQAEINDETDVLTSNRSVRKRSKGPMNIMQGMMANKSKRVEGIQISPQLVLATYQYLSTSIFAFNHDEISKSILDRLLKQDVFVKLKFKSLSDGTIDPSTFIYEKGVPADYFVLILEGRVNAEIGKEGLIFESGPFHYFGAQSLNPNNSDDFSTPTETRKFGVASILSDMSHFIPDYTVRAITDVIFLKISRSMYKAARQATVLERSYAGPGPHDINKAGDDFDTQMGIIINGTDEDGSKINLKNSVSFSIPSSPALEKINEKDDLKLKPSTLEILNANTKTEDSSTENPELQQDYRL